MENINTITETPVQKQNNTFKYLFFISFFVLITGVIISFLIFKNYTKEIVCEETSGNSIKTNKQAVKDDEIKWVEADMGLFSFNYPFGWHVAYLSPRVESGDGINKIAINKNYIDDGARGGPLADIVFYSKSSDEDPETVLKNNITEFKKSYIWAKEIKEETLDLDIGKVYHYTVSGFSEMSGDFTFERYYFIVKPNSSKDNINKPIIYVETNSQNYSDILKQIILSVRAK